MLVRRKSVFSGQVNEMEIPVTQGQLDLWQSGESIQYAMPKLNANEREFLKTGLTPDEWETIFGGIEDA